MPTTTLPNPKAAHPEQRLDQKAIRGVWYLLRRQLFTKALGFFCNIALARLLSPSDFGAFGMIAGAVGFFSLFGDCGLAASLIRDKNQPTAHDESSIFTVQQMLIIAPSVVLLVAAPLIVNAYHMAPHMVWVVWTLVAAGVVSSFKVIPSIRLERNLEFEKLSKIELLQSMTWQGTALALAFCGRGIWSFVIASFLSQVVGVILIYRVQAWRPRWSWDWELCRNRLKFGISYQSASICSFLKDSINPLFIGLLCGAKSVGLVTFAITTAAYPLILTTLAGRVYFPLFSRYQHDPVKLRASLESAIRWNMLVTLCATSLLVPLAPYLVEHVYGAKWMPSLTLLYLFCIANPFCAMTWPIFSLANALGRPDLPLKFSGLFMFATWAVAAPLISIFGVLGFALAQPILCLFNFWLFGESKKLVEFDLWRACIPALEASAVTISVLVSIRQCLHPVTAISAWALLIFGALLFIGSALIFGGATIITEGREALQQVLKRKTAVQA